MLWCSGKILNRTLNDYGTKTVFVDERKLLIIKASFRCSPSNVDRNAPCLLLFRKNFGPSLFSTESPVSLRTQFQSMHGLTSVFTMAGWKSNLKMIQLNRKLVDNYSCWAITCDWNPKLSIRANASRASKRNKWAILSHGRFEYWCGGRDRGATNHRASTVDTNESVWEEKRTDKSELREFHFSQLNDMTNFWPFLMEDCHTWSCFQLGFLLRGARMKGSHHLFSASLAFYRAECSKNLLGPIINFTNESNCW